ncbi:MAG: hypothetical protein Q7J54_00115 [Candidatus Woesearchaeota archaeon]|nr:hypothetical protein [Candidatus Woesearchaeota archaeon]
MAEEKGNLALAIIIVIVFTAIIALGLYLIYNESLFTEKRENPVACTQEAKICPDGSSVGRTGPNCEFTKCPEVQEVSAFDSLVNFTISKQIKFSDGLTVTLTEINDSRCKPGVVCIQAGELSPVFTMMGGNIGDLPEEVRLGTSTVKKVIKNGYIFELKDVIENTATITISKELKTLGNCYIGGCSKEICSDKEGVVSICMYKKEYACYKNAKCERQINGQCGWTQEPQLQACLKTN